MGAGGTFTPGEVKTRPGKYIRIRNTGGTPNVRTLKGVVAAAFAADWGPLGLYPNNNGKISEDELEDLYIGGSTSDLEEIFAANAEYVIPYRVGTGGTKATKNFTDTNGAPVDVIKIEAKYVGTIALKVTIRDSLTDATKKECIIFVGTTEKQRFTYAKGAAGEVDALVAAYTADGSDWVVITKLAAGNGLTKDVSAVALVGGANPDIDAASYTTAMSALEVKQWNIIVTDSETAAVHTSLKTYVERLFSEGKRVRGVVAEPTSVLYATRKTNSAALNSFLMHYVGNGIIRNDGSTMEGHRAGAWMAGKIASVAYNYSLTGEILSDAVTIKGELTDTEIKDGITSGMLMFTYDESGKVAIEYGINTLNTINDTDAYDEGWKKIRRVSTRFEVIERIMAKWGSYKIDNNDDGRKTHIGNANGIISDMVKENGLIDGSCVLDPDNPPAGDSAWWIVNVLDLDNVEKQYTTFGFQY